MNLKNNEKAKIIWTLLPYILIVFGAVLLFLHAPLSFCSSDESFYASTTNRFLQGDAIFVHEWFPTQLVSIILVPIQGLFVKINGSNDGVLLFMRYVYIVFSALSASIIYKLLKSRHSKYAATCCAMFVLFYAHLNIATMSYYTLSYHCFILAMLFFIKGYDQIEPEAIRKPLDIGRAAIIYYFIAGVFVALDVLSLPSLALVYFAFIFIFLIAFIVDRTVKSKMPIFIHRLINAIYPALLYSLIGIVIPAIIVLIYVLPRSGVMGLVNNLGYVLSDEEHVTSLVAPFKNFFLAVRDVFGKDVFLSVLLTIASVIVYFVRDIKKIGNKFIKPVSTIIFILDIIMLFYYISVSLGHTGFLSTAIVMFAFPIFFLSEKKDYLLFWLLFIGGLVFSMVYSYSSMCDLYVLSIGHSISAVAGMCIIFDYNFRTKNDSAFLGIVLAAILGIFILLTATLRFINIYRDAPINQLSEMIDKGPAKGLKTTPEHKEMYDKLLDVIQSNSEKGEQIFITKLLPWGYLATEGRCGAPTTWRTMFNSDRLRLYYEANPDRFPDIILVMPDNAGAYDTCGDVVADPVPNENEIGGYLLNQVKDYEISEDNGVVIYKKTK